MAIPIGTKCRVVVDYLMVDGSPMHVCHGVRRWL